MVVYLFSILANCASSLESFIDIDKEANVVISILNTDPYFIVSNTTIIKDLAKDLEKKFDDLMNRITLESVSEVKQQLKTYYFFIQFLKAISVETNLKQILSFKDSNELKTIEKWVDIYINSLNSNQDWKLRKEYVMIFISKLLRRKFKIDALAHYLIVTDISDMDLSRELWFVMKYVFEYRLTLMTLDALADHPSLDNYVDLNKVSYYLYHDTLTGKERGASSNDLIYYHKLKALFKKKAKNEQIDPNEFDIKNLSEEDFKLFYDFRKDTIEATQELSVRASWILYEMFNEAKFDNNSLETINLVSTKMADAITSGNQ